MPRMLGERALPEAVQERRRQIRERAMSLREPVRNFRESNVPGPDLIGQVESRVSGLRDRFVSRDTILSRISERRSESAGGDSGSDSSNGNSGGSSSNNTSTSLT